MHFRIYGEMTYYAGYAAKIFNDMNEMGWN
jgi:hypothetical protein